MAGPPKSPNQHPISAEHVRPEDLNRLGVLHDMLRVLNEPLAGAPEIARHVERFPALKARVAQRFRQRFRRDLPGVREQIARLGNRDFEKILLDLLEDLTVLKADMEAQQGSREPPAPASKA